MKKISKNPKRNLGTLFKNLALAACLASCSFAQAGTLTFEGTNDTPIISVGDLISVGQYWVESYAIGGTQIGDLAGMFIDGSDNGLCYLSCPVNNPTMYYAGLNDGYFYFGLLDHSPFSVKSLQASFIGAGQPIGAVSSLLRLQGYNATDQLVSGFLQINLPGENANHEFAFNSYDLSATAFGNTDFSYVRVYLLACDLDGRCTNGDGLANFAVDNIVTVTVPEPTTWALFGLGLLGLGIFTRERRGA